MKNINLDKFVDKNQNVWKIIREDGKIILQKEKENLVFFLDNQTGNKLLNRKIKELRG